MVFQRLNSSINWNDGEIVEHGNIPVRNRGNMKCPLLTGQVVETTDSKALPLYFWQTTLYFISC